MYLVIGSIIPVCSCGCLFLYYVFSVFATRLKDVFGLKRVAIYHPSPDTTLSRQTWLQNAAKQHIFSGIYGNRMESLYLQN